MRGPDESLAALPLTPQAHPTPYTLHPTPYTLHPTPYTLRPAPYTGRARDAAGTLTISHSLPPSLYLVGPDESLAALPVAPYLTLSPSLTPQAHPTPYTLHPTPYTLHPTPCTLHPTPPSL